MRMKEKEIKISREVQSDCNEYKIKAVSSALGAVNEPLPSPKWCLPSHETTWGSAGNATVFYCCTGQHPRIWDWMGLDLGSNGRKFKNVTYNMHVQMYTKDDWWSKVSNVAFATLFYLMLLNEVKMSSSIYNMNTYSIFYWHCQLDRCNPTELQYTIKPVMW